MPLSLLPKHKLTPVFWIKAMLVALPILVILNLLNHHLLLTPARHYSYHPGQPTRVVGLTTGTDVIRTADASLRWKMTKDSTPFTVTIPRLIEGVRVQAKLAVGSQPYVALSAKGSRGDSLTTIAYSAALDALDWPKIHANGRTLWQRPSDSKHDVKQYSSLSAFRQDPPNPETIGVAGFDHMTYAVVENYTPSTTPLTINHQLRGHHQLYVYAANETIDLRFEKVDLNRQVGKDGVTVRIGLAKNMTSSHHDWLKTVTVGDDGNTKKTGPAGKPQTVHLKLPNAAPGVYVIDISASGDSLLRNFSSYQHYLAFGGQVWLAEGQAYAQPTFAASTLTTNGRSVTVAAMHAQGKQTITVNGKGYAINDVKVNHVVSKLKGESSMTVPKGDATISSDGLIAFTPFRLLPDGARVLDLTTAELDLDGLDYVVADYSPTKGTTITVTHQYAVSELSLLGKQLRFSLDAPGLQASSATLGLKSLDTTLIRGPFPWSKVWKKLGLTK